MTQATVTQAAVTQAAATRSLAHFDFDAFSAALDAERRSRDLTWYELASVLWEQSCELNARRNDHPL